MISFATSLCTLVLQQRRHFTYSCGDYLDVCALIIVLVRLTKKPIQRADTQTSSTKQMISRPRSEWRSIACLTCLPVILKELSKSYHLGSTYSWMAADVVSMLMISSVVAFTSIHQLPIKPKPKPMFKPKPKPKRQLASYRKELRELFEYDSSG